MPGTLSEAHIFGVGMRPALGSQHAVVVHSSPVEFRIGCGELVLVCHLDMLLLLLPPDCSAAAFLLAYFQLTIVYQLQIRLE
jgi:hypothetical protein